MVLLAIVLNHGTQGMGFYSIFLFIPMNTRSRRARVLSKRIMTIKNPPKILSIHSKNNEYNGKYPCRDEEKKEKCMNHGNVKTLRLDLLFFVFFSENCVSGIFGQWKMVFLKVHFLELAVARCTRRRRFNARDNQSLCRLRKSSERPFSAVYYYYCYGYTGIFTVIISLFYYIQ